MNHKIIMMSLVLAISACKITSGPGGCSRSHRELPEPPFSEFAQATPQKDTLYLIKDDWMSPLIASIWNSDTSAIAPKIVMVTKEDMVCIKNRCGKKNKKK